jgi:hypothetical protein
VPTGALGLTGVISSQCGGQSPDGLEAWRQMIARGNEGYVAKDEASPSVTGEYLNKLEAGRHDLMWACSSGSPRPSGCR